MSIVRATHEEQNQDNYAREAVIHNKLGLNATLYLAYRDVPALLQKHLFDKEQKSSYRVLDFGCGAGLSTELIAKMIRDAGYHADIVGVDISEENINFSSLRLPQAEFLKINPGEPLNHLGKFDLIVCNFVLVEVKQATMIGILKDIQSLLSDSGVAIVTNCASKAYRRTNKWYTFTNDFDENVPSEPKGDKMKFKEDQPIKVQLYVSYGSDLSFTFFDFFHSGSAYRDAYQAVGLNLLETHKPLGKESDGMDWVSEKQYPPYKIHILSRQPQFGLEVKNIKSPQ